MIIEEMLKYVDAGADFYLRAMGDAEHMEIIDNGIYEIMRSCGNINNLSSIYNIRLDQLSDDELKKTVQDIKNLKIHTWWPLASSDRVIDIIHEKKPVYSIEDFEIYGVMQPEDLPKYPETKGFISIKQVKSLSDFVIWCDLDNNTEHSGTVVFYPKNHMHLVDSGKLTCFIGYVDNMPVATSAILNNKGIVSLEFISTLPDYRKKGIAKELCQHALKYAFNTGANVISVRAVGDGRTLAKTLGFHFVETNETAV